MTVYVKAYSTGKSFAYKALKINYAKNYPPSIGGDVQNNLVNVREADGKTDETQDFKLFFKDREGDRVTKYQLSPSLDNTPWVKYQIIG